MKNRLLLTFSIVVVSVFSWSQRAAVIQQKSLKPTGETQQVVVKKDNYFKTVDEFAATFDKADTLSDELHQKAFDLYNAKDWKNLEIFFTENKLNGGWPPAMGGYNITDNVPLKAGMTFDRYSNAIGKFDGNGVPKLGGNFTSPVYNNVSYTFTQRALNQPQENYDFYYHITVVKDCPFTSQNATVIPWFNQEGNGQQTMWKIPLDEQSGYPLTWNQLAEQGYIKITIVDSPSGKFEQTEGKTIP
ncbi:MAG: glycohydrolase toxin TNT-related protein [Fluviicola sp.]|nr:glycohydrolase toxin TNT-related protein [Fluviicola sp.]